MRERLVKERIGRNASTEYFVKSSEFQISGLEEGFYCWFHYCDLAVDLSILRVGFGPGQKKAAYFRLKTVHP